MDMDYIIGFAIIIGYIFIGYLITKLIRKWTLHLNFYPRILTLSFSYTLIFGIGFVGGGNDAVGFAFPFPVGLTGVLDILYWVPWKIFINGFLIPLAFWWLILFIAMLVKAKTSVLLLLVSLTINCFGQSDERINSIRKIVEQLNKDTTYTTKTLDNEQWMEHTTDGGGQLTGYFKNGQLVKVVKWVGLSSCVTNFEYYLQNNSLIFVYGQEKVVQYVDSIASFDWSKQTLGMECRFYFDNGKLIQSKFTEQTRCSNPPSDTQAPDLLADSKRYLTLLKK